MKATIARQLLITERTVKAHLTGIFRKLGIVDRLSLALRASAQDDSEQVNYYSLVGLVRPPLRTADRCSARMRLRCSEVGTASGGQSISAGAVRADCAGVPLRLLFN